MDNQFDVILFRGIGLFIIAILNLILAIVLWKKSKSKTVNYLYFIALTSSFYAFFCGATFFFWDSMPDLRLFWYRATWLGVFILPNLLGFVYYFNNNLKLVKIKILLWFLGAVIISALALFTPLMTESVYRKSISIFGVAGRLDPLGRSYIFIGTVLALYYLSINYKSTTDRLKKTRLKYFIFGLGFYIIGSIIAVGLIPLIYGQSGYYDLVVYCSTVWIFLTSYAVLRHHLLDIDIVIKKTFIVSVIIAFISGVMMSVSLLSNWFVNNIPGFKVWTIPLIAGLTTYLIGNLFLKKSKEAEKIKYEFITVAAHKLRMPLTRIKFILEDLPPETSLKGKIITSKITNDVNQTVELLEELLAASGTQNDMCQYMPEEMRLEILTDQIIASFKEQFEYNKIDLKFEAEKNLPKIQADVSRISTVLRIMIENAIMYIPEDYKKRKIEISVKRDRNNLLFTIKDSGIGIDIKDQPYIFLNFYRGKNARLIDTEGLGLALYIAKNIIKRHGGQIGFNSKGEGNGANFWFTLPI